MDKDLLQKWVAALRSGNYKQGEEYLCYNGKYCCLGVLVEQDPRCTKEDVMSDTDPTTWTTSFTLDALGKETLDVIPDDFIDDTLTIGYDGEELPQWYLDEVGLPYEMQLRLIKMNDGHDIGDPSEFVAKHTFPEIANYIEKNLL